MFVSVSVVRGEPRPVRNYTERIRTLGCSGFGRFAAAIIDVSWNHESTRRTGLERGINLRLFHEGWATFGSGRG